MHPVLLYITLKTIPKIDAKDYEEAKVILKPRKTWGWEAVSYFTGLIASVLCFILLSTTPYVGQFFFLIGFLGSLYSILYGIRALLVYINYDDLFTEENIKKLIDKD